MKIPFDIKYRDKIESGEYKVIYVENSSTEQYPVEILKWDSNSDAGCIIGCIRRNGKDRVYVFEENGKHKVSGGDRRLFIVTPEPEMSEFENGMLRYLQDAVNKKDDSEIVESTKEHSIKLLSIARDEFNRQIENDYREIIHGAYKRGKADAEQEIERRLQSGELLTQEHHEKLMEIQYNETLDGVKKNWHDYFTPQAVTDIYNAGRNDVLKDLPRWKKCQEDDPIGCVYNCAKKEDSLLYYNGHTLRLIELEKLPGFNDEDHE